jgi:thioester reductase-like protein
MNSIFNRLDFWAEQTPDKLLYAYLDINGNQTDKYTYSEFIYRTNAIAGNLYNEYKFKQGDRILLAYPPGLEMICAFYACARLGLIPVPVYPPSASGFESSLNKMAYIAKDCQASAVLTSRDYYWSIKLNLSRTSIAECAFTESHLSKLAWINTEDFVEANKNGFPAGYSEVLFLQYTSGSTSDPKGVMVSHQNILHNCDLAIDFVPHGVSWLPQYHDMGLIGYYIFIALKGGHTYGFSSMDFIQRPSLWLETMSKYKCSAASAPNFAFDYCLRPGKISEKTLETLDLSSLEYLMTAAEPVVPATYNRFIEFFKPYGLNPKSSFAAYGLAENTLAVSNYGRTFVSADQASFKQNRLKILPVVTEATPHTDIMSCGKPLGDITVKIVDPETRHALKDEYIGEVWITGKSKCLGYWNKPELSKEMFHATIVGENANANNYLRTGDIGFMYQDELYICGRAKDMIIIRGLNYYPQDIEKIVEETASHHVRHGFVAAFDVFDEEEKLVVVVGVKNPKSLPDPIKIAEDIRRGLTVQAHAIAFVSAKEIPKTSSGKIMRHKAKEMYQEGKFTILQQFSGAAAAELFSEETQSNNPFEELKRKYGLKGTEHYSLGKAGLDSIDLVVLLHDIKDLLKGKGADALSKQIDIRLIQEISISELFDLVDQFENASAIAIIRLKNMLMRLQKEHHDFERKMMLSDVHLTFDPPAPVYDPAKKATNVLLTGATGFFGPFILKSLLEQTDQTVYALIRAASDAQGMERLISAMESVEPLTASQIEVFKQRVIPVCGDLGQHQLGLTHDTWKFLAENMHEIYHNGAVVNYLFNYDKMRNINVIGTNEILKLAFEGHAKVFNHISTTFIFGWAVRDVLYEHTSNDNLDLLDFGYSQTKWVSEEIVKDAMRRGLVGRIFRPALITPSIHGGGHNFDISIRLLAFMINYGIGVDAQNQVSFIPADIAANNIVAISGTPDTVGKTYHVTRDHYSNMGDITDIITKLTGKQFKIFKLKEFVPEIIERCKKDDLLFPLLDFLVRSVENISAMEFKLYDSTNLKTARNASEWGKQDPSLEDTVRGILIFLSKNGIISGVDCAELEAGMAVEAPQHAHVG